MECPKCKTVYGPESKYCPPCDERLVSLPVAGGKALLVADITISIEGWAMVGHLLIREEALYFFFRDPRWEGAQDKKALRMGAEALAGLLGGMLIRSAGKLMEPRDFALKSVKVNDRQNVQHLIPPSLEDGSLVAKCPHYFRIFRDDIRTASFHWGGLLDIATNTVNVHAEGKFAAAQAPAFMTWRGYPVERHGLTRRRAMQFALAGVLGLGAIALELGDAYEANQLGYHYAPRAWAAISAIHMGVEDITYHDGVKHYRTERGDVPAKEFPWWFKYWYDMRHIWLLVAMSGTILIIVLRSADRQARSL